MEIHGIMGSRSVEVEMPVGTIGQWRPIATAPRDGTDILVALPWGKVLIVRWNQLRRWSNDVRPTHWMPLPAPPL
jgi:hypothetical protein